MAISNYYNRFNPSKKYEKALFLSASGLQSAEMNEIQDYLHYKIKQVGDALFKDGDVVSGAVCIINNETGDTTIESGKIYLNGAVREVSSANLKIPVNQVVRIGVYYKEKTITYLEDPELRDPAVDTSNYRETGAARLQYNLEWGFECDETKSGDETSGDFYVVYNVSNGVLIQKAPAPQLDSVSTSLARYDRESNGSYVVKGMMVTCLSSNNGAQVFAINEGKAHVDGYEVELSHSLRVRFEDDYDLKEINSDPYVFHGDSDCKMVINVNYSPIASIKRVSITAEKTINLNHGAYTGCMDQLPDTSISEIVSIRQGAITYVKDTDYRLKAGAVDWSPGGAEPAPGSTYEITYRHITQITPKNVTDDSFEVSGAVESSIVQVDYSYKMPRYDLITIDSEGIVRRIKGISRPYSPGKPKSPTGQMELAYIYQTWRTDEKPEVTNNAIRAVLMSDIELIKNLILSLYTNVAQLELKNDINSSEPAAKRGIFVDPFLDDDLRDQGIEQAGAIVNGVLMLAIDPTVHDLGRAENPYLLPYELEPVITQELKTGYMKINPYCAYDPIPADVKVNLNIDQWTDVDTKWSSPITKQISVWSRAERTYYSTNEELVSAQSKDAEFMRSVRQNFKVDGFKAGEKLKRIVFDGVELEPQEKMVEE